MPRGRKRKDPEAAPVDGDYAMDQVVGKEPGFEYALILDEDLPKMKSRGYVDVERSVDTARPAFDMGAQGDERTYHVGANRLTLMKITKERYDAIHAASRRRGAARMEPIVEQARKSGGKLTQELV